MKRPKPKWGWKDDGGWEVPFMFAKSRRDILLGRGIPEAVVAKIESLIATLRAVSSAERGEPTGHEITAELKAIQKPVSDLIGMIAKLDDATREVLIDHYVLAFTEKGIKEKGIKEKGIKEKGIKEKGIKDQVWDRAEEGWAQIRPNLDLLNRALGAALKFQAVIDGRRTRKGLERALSRQCKRIFLEHGLQFTAAPNGPARQLLPEAFAAFGLTQDPRPYIREIIAKSNKLAKRSRAAG